MTLDALELASSALVGPSHPAGAAAGRGSHTRRPVKTAPSAALEAAVLDGLLRPPCLVSFSGGRDSSLVLAAAARVARRQDLEAPIPVTWRFPDAPASHETAWQEAVVGALSIAEWVRLEATSELDLMGPVAQPVLAAHGVLYPANTYLHVPLLEAARGGTLLTGLGGDQLFEPRPRPGPHRLAQRHFGLHRPGWRRRRVAASLPWLQPGSIRTLARRRAAERRDAPRRFDQWVAWQARRRSLAVGIDSYDLVAAGAGALILHPLVDHRVVRAVAAVGGRDGFSDRSELLAACFGDLLPAGVGERSDKARFDPVVWNVTARSFIETWDGTGVDSDVVDVAALKAVWSKPWPDFRSALLCQTAWLAAASSSRLQPAR